MTEEEYMADVRARGGFYARELSANCPNLKPWVEGFPGAGFPPRGGQPLRYELAPWSVAFHVVTPLKLLSYPYDQTNFGQRIQGELSDAATKVLDEAKRENDILGGLPQQVAEVPRAVVGSILGLPPELVTLLLVVVAYAALQQAGFVPSFKKVIR